MKKYYTIKSNFGNQKTFIEVDGKDINAVNTLNKLGLIKITKKSMQKTLAWIKKEMLWGTENYIELISYKQFMSIIEEV